MRKNRSDEIMEIKSVAVLGAGAVGSYVIWGLSGVKNIELGVVAEGERAKRLKEKGCTINHTVYHPHVWTPQEAHGVDLLVVSLKYGALPGALESIREAVGENTIVMSLMNGVDSEEMISTVIPKANIMYSLIKVASHKEEDGYCFDPETTIGIIFGELEAPYESERVRAIEELFADTGLHFRHTDYIREEMWSKFSKSISSCCLCNFCHDFQPPTVILPISQFPVYLHGSEVFLLQIQHPVRTAVTRRWCFQIRFRLM